MIVKNWNELTAAERLRFVRLMNDEVNGGAVVGDVNNPALLEAIEAAWVPFSVDLRTVGGVERLLVQPDTGPIPHTPEQHAKSRVFCQEVLLDPAFPVSFVPERTLSCKECGAETDNGTLVHGVGCDRILPERETMAEFRASARAALRIRNARLAAEGGRS